MAPHTAAKGTLSKKYSLRWPWHSLGRFGAACLWFGLSSTFSSAFVTEGRKPELAIVPRPGHRPLRLRIPPETRRTDFHWNKGDVALNVFKALRGGGDRSPFARIRRKKISRHSTTFSRVESGGSESDVGSSPFTGEMSGGGIRRRKGMTVALAASYFSVMGAKCALPAVLSLLTAPSTGLTFPTSTSLMPQQLMARQLTCATLAVAAGKLLLGPLIDHFGGVLSLQIALCLLAFLLMVISLGQSFFLFSIAWIAVDFIFSSCWAACINAIRQVFPVDEWPDQIATLAAAARTGNASAFAVFAAILHFFERRGMRQAWRPVFAVSAVAQLIPVALLAYFGRSTKTRDAATGGSDSASHTSPKAFTQQEQRQQQEAHDSKPSFRASLSTVWRLAETPDFWLHLVSRSVLMVFASFLLFVPTLMTEVYATSPSFGAQAGSLYALGCLLSVTVAAPFYSRISRKSRASHLLWITGLLLFGATGSSLAQLGHVNGRWILSSAASAVLLFAWGFSFAIPFYLPPSLYALRRGGHESSATIADIFDIGGFALLAAFNGYVAGIQQSIPGAWVPTFQITTFCSLISFLSLSIVAWREGENQ